MRQGQQKKAQALASTQLAKSWELVVEKWLSDEGKIQEREKEGKRRREVSSERRAEETSVNKTLDNSGM